MKYLFIFLLTLNSVLAADLTIDITSLKNQRGVVNIAIWDNSQDYPAESKAFVTRTLRADDEMTTVFQNLNPGRYAVAIFHDKNTDGRLNTGRFGIPTEEFGFSTNPGFLTGQPSFSRIAIKLENDKRIQIKLRKAI